TSVPTLSALQLVKGVKKGEETFIAKLTKRLPPRREVDHRMDMEGRKLDPLSLLPPIPLKVIWMKLALGPPPGRVLRFLALKWDCS
ncbi:hypothetical protein Tco_1480657, partial [Tanacetum coccineum]